MANAFEKMTERVVIAMAIDLVEDEGANAHDKALQDTCTALQQGLVELQNYLNAKPTSTNKSPSPATMQVTPAAATPKPGG